MQLLSHFSHQNCRANDGKVTEADEEVEEKLEVMKRDQICPCVTSNEWDRNSSTGEAAWGTSLTCYWEDCLVEVV